MTQFAALMEQQGSDRSPSAPAAALQQKLSFVRIRFCHRATTVFMPFSSGVDTVASLSAQLVVMLGAGEAAADAPPMPLALFTFKGKDKQRLDDTLVLTLHNTDPCSLWYCCPEAQYASVVAPPTSYDSR